MPRFSVVIPTFNRAERLRKTIRSVLDQTFADFEVLVMDDGSVDDTRAMVESFGDARLRYAWETNSGGPARPRNRGIEAATSEWICFLDADDVWYPSKLEDVLDAIGRAPEADAFCNYEYLVDIRVGGKSLLRHGPVTEDFYRTMLLEGNRCSISAMTVRRAFLEDHGLRFNTSSDYVIVEDYDMWLRMARCGARFGFIEKPLGEYLIEGGNISSNRDRVMRNEKILLHDHVFTIQGFEPDKQRLWGQVVFRHRMAMAKGAFMEGQGFAALWQIFRAMLESPSGAAIYVFARFKRLCMS